MRIVLFAHNAATSIIIAFAVEFQNVVYTMGIPKLQCHVSWEFQAWLKNPSRPWKKQWFSILDHFNTIVNLAGRDNDLHWLEEQVHGLEFNRPTLGSGLREIIFDFKTDMIASLLSFNLQNEILTRFS